MRYSCRKCDFVGAVCTKTVRYGHFYRTSDRTWVQRFRCNTCRTYFSTATYHPYFRQKKRHKNRMLRELLSSSVSQRRAARILRINKVTVERKFRFLALEAEFFLRKRNLLQPKAKVIEFDDMETSEHSKYKPLSITLAVESETRRILGVEVSQMATKVNSPRAKRYLPRPDTRREGRLTLLKRIKDLVEEDCVIKSDSNPYYARDVREVFPHARHIQYEGKRGASTGQGELKKLRFDPIFSLNHTCAKIRADVNRLFRRTWCTTKRADQLYAHLVLYADYHNAHL